MSNHTNNFFSNVMLQSAQPEPKVGDGATICLWSDRVACTVIAVNRTPKGRIRSVVIRRDTAIRVDNNGRSDAQEWRYEPNPFGQTDTIKFRNGKPCKNALKVAWGVRQHFYDYSF